MKILVINPNSTTSMTDKIVESARQRASTGTEIIGASGTDAPASIQGYYDEAMSVPGLLARLKQAEADGVDGVVVACFDDPGIGACREVFSGPVLGICEAAVKAASMISTSFSVVTTLPRSVPVIEDLIRSFQEKAAALGYEDQYRGTQVTPGDPLELVKSPELLDAALAKAVKAAIEEDGAEAVIMGGGPLSASAIRLQPQLKVPLVVAVSAAARAAVKEIQKTE